MIIKALKAFSDGVLSLHEGAIADVPDAIAEIYIRFGYAIEYTEGGDIDLSAYVKISDLPYVTPEQFGAKGDGVTDDTQAFISACDYAVTSGKRVVKLTKKYCLKQNVSLTNEKYLHLIIEGTSFSGCNVEQSKYLEKPMNIIAEGGFNVGYYVKLKNVGFLNYGITIEGSRVRIEGCVFNRCDTAITLVNIGNGSSWLGEVFIDNCDFSLCTTGINATVSENGGYFHDCRVFDCTVIRGNIFLTGKISAWKIRGNHIYSTLPISGLSSGMAQINDNYFDTNDIAVDMTVRSGMCQFVNNLFLKSATTLDESQNANPVCKIVGNSGATVIFMSNMCTKASDSSHPDEVFVKFSGSGDFEQANNISKITLTNN